MTTFRRVKFSGINEILSSGNSLACIPVKHLLLFPQIE